MKLAIRYKPSSSNIELCIRRNSSISSLLKSLSEITNGVEKPIMICLFRSNNLSNKGLTEVVILHLSRTRIDCSKRRELQLRNLLLAYAVRGRNSYCILTVSSSCFIKSFAIIAVLPKCGDTSPLFVPKRVIRILYSFKRSRSTLQSERAPYPKQRTGEKDNVRTDSKKGVCPTRTIRLPQD